jgi:hypothetical protein
MLFRLTVLAVCAFWMSAASSVAQQTTATPADLYAQIPILGASGDSKLLSGDVRGAVDDFKKAFEGSRTLSQQYPQEPAYRENAYYYLGRLASAFVAQTTSRPLGNWPSRALVAMRKSWRPMPLQRTTRKPPTRSTDSRGSRC